MGSILCVFDCCPGVILVFAMFLELNNSDSYSVSPNLFIQQLFFVLTTTSFYSAAGKKVPFKIRKATSHRSNDESNSENLDL